MAYLTLSRSVAPAWQRHKTKWRDCERCPLHSERTNVVLARGNLPCGLLFFGEGPGESEDLIGYPFVGPAGKLGDDLIEEALEDADHQPSIAFANVLACIPWDKDGDGSKTGTIRAPKGQEAEACSPRVKAFFAIAKPRLVVCLGRNPRKHVPKSYTGPTAELTHPSAILRQDPNRQNLAAKRFVLSLVQAINGVDWNV